MQRKLRALFWYFIEGCNAITGLLIRSPTLPKFQKSGISLPLLIAQESKQIKLVKNSPFLVIKKKGPSNHKIFFEYENQCQKKEICNNPPYKNGQSDYSDSQKFILQEPSQTKMIKTIQFLRKFVRFWKKCIFRFVRMHF